MNWRGLVLAVGLARLAHADETLLDAMDAVSFQATGEKAHVELVNGKTGKALKFSFDNDASGAYVRGRVGATAAWDKAAGISFWVKGDGSDHLGGIEVIWNDDYTQRYAFAFPINNTDWKQIVVPWRDLIPELSKMPKQIDPANGNAPSKLGPFMFGKWWYWKDYAAHFYSIDELRLEPVIQLPADPPIPKGAPLARVLAKLKAHQPVTIVTMGDSLTDFAHWANRESNWPTMVQNKLKEKYGSEITLINPALGGTELRQNLVLLPRWTAKTPAPDLVTILFGFNDWSAGMRGPGFLETMKDAVDRIRRATNGKADVLILTTCPPLEDGAKFSELADACRDAAHAKNAGLADIFTPFRATPDAGKPQLYVHDKGHLGLAGHTLVAQTVFDAISRAGQ